MEILNYPLLFGVGVLSAFMNVLAGGGSIISMPILIFLGLDGAMANGTNRLAICSQNIFAIFSFHGEEKYDLRSALFYSAWTLPGAIVGAFFAVNIKDQLFHKVLAVVMIAVMLTVLLPPARDPKELGARKSWLIYPALLGIGFYGGFIQAGVGFLIMAAFTHILRFRLVKVNMVKVFIVFIYTIPALLIFILSGRIQYTYAIALAAGNALGGWWSAKLAIVKGEKFIRLVLVLVVIAMSVKLLGLI
ncbi:sulfite exporter TauE/SafE family protein [candidate division KSB1 bacterium]|nr:sulfite exporter TauE/SafE family protein [candidate division KSB1 bacterium]RQW09777.1 MAG: sulfite exporter TauE/SafE family protein [candidate division KSB1 bacterium]